MLTLCATTPRRPNLAGKLYVTVCTGDIHGRHIKFGWLQVAYRQHPYTLLGRQTSNLLEFGSFPGHTQAFQERHPYRSATCRHPCREQCPRGLSGLAGGAFWDWLEEAARAPWLKRSGRARASKTGTRTRGKGTGHGVRGRVAGTLAADQHISCGL